LLINGATINNTYSAFSVYLGQVCHSVLFSHYKSVW